MATFIPHDVLLHHILPRLPAKSARRFMCVSKELRSFLSSKTFSRMHSRCHIDYHRNHEKFLVLFHEKPGTLGIIDCEEPDNVLTQVSLKLPKTGKNSEIKFLTSFHGLVCLARYFDFILWNPVTSEYKKMSKTKSRITRLDMFYSSCEDDYKLVSVIRRNYFHIYSLKSDSWKTIGFQGTYDLNADDRLSTGTCLNENLYFVDYREKCLVTRFDTKTETFTEMKGTPDLSDDQIKNTNLNLMVKHGCIHVCIMYDIESFSYQIVTLIELWKINEDGKWKKMETYRVDPGSLHMYPLYMMSKGNMLMCRYDFTLRYLYNVHLKRNKVKKNKPCKGIAKEKEPLPVSDMRISQIVRYNETLVSPNQYTK